MVDGDDTQRVRLVSAERQLHQLPRLLRQRITGSGGGQLEGGGEERHR